MSLLNETFRDNEDEDEDDEEDGGGGSGLEGSERFGGEGDGSGEESSWAIWVKKRLRGLDIYR